MRITLRPWVRVVGTLTTWSRCASDITGRSTIVGEQRSKKSMASTLNRLQKPLGNRRLTDQEINHLRALAADWDKSHRRDLETLIDELVQLRLRDMRYKIIGEVMLEEMVEFMMEKKGYVYH